MFLGVAFKFGIEPAMYSILTYFTALRTSDYVVDGFEEFTALTIVSKQPEKVKYAIVNDFNKAISVYKGERGYLPGSYHIHEDCDIIMAIVTRLEIHRLKPVSYTHLDVYKRQNRYYYSKDDEPIK